MHGRTRNREQRIIGIWDVEKKQLTLGGLLIFLEELAIQRMLHKIDRCDIYFKISAHSQKKFSSLLLIPCYFKGIRKVVYCNSSSQVQRQITNQTYVFNQSSPNTLFIQKIFTQHQKIPRLTCKPVLHRWARGFIKKYVSPKKNIVVHLKNAGGSNISNANFLAWGNFFLQCFQKYNVVFTLIGNEDIPDAITRIPNVIMAGKSGSTVGRDLALTETAFMFMGMASGPCNMAVFNSIPYLIYKDPTHHSEEMVKELGEDDHFIFASPYQKVLRKVHTTPALLKDFQKLYTQLTV